MPKLSARATAPWILAALVAPSFFARDALATPCNLRPFDIAPRQLSPFDARQRQVDAVSLRDGGFVVTFDEGWRSQGVILPEPSEHSRDGDVEGVLFLRLGIDGRPIGEAEIVNVRRQGSQEYPVVAADPATGGFAIAWLDEGRPRLRRFAADGTPTTGEIAVSDVPSIYVDGIRRSLRLVIDPQGHAMVAWEQDRESFEPANLFYAPVSPDGVVGLVRDIRLSDDDRYHEPQLAVRGFGGFTLLWSEPDTTETVYTQSVDLDGVPFGARRAIPGLGPIVDLATAEPDSIVSVWTTLPWTSTRPPRRALIDAGNGRVIVEREIADATRGAWPRIDNSGSGCVLLSFDLREGGYLLRSFDSGSARLVEGSELVVPGPSFLPMAIASSRPRGSKATVVVAWSANRRIRFATTALVGSRRLDLGVDDRFEVQVRWQDFDNRVGDGFSVPLTLETGAFWFFDPANLELTIKVLDGRAINGHFWVFNGSLTNVAYTLTITDTTTGAVYTITNPLGRFGSFGDVEALPAE